MMAFEKTSESDDDDFKTTEGVFDSKRRQSNFSVKFEDVDITESNDELDDGEEDQKSQETTKQSRTSTAKSNAVEPLNLVGDTGSSSNEVDKDDTDRGHWSGKLDFLLSCLGYAVGLGNVWRFPYLCFKHGGGAFLIPYALMLIFIGIPCFFLELSIGQYAAMGPATIYSNLSPMFKGLGFSNVFASVFVALYYNMIIAWTIYYLFASFTSQLPWESCNNDFNTDFCFSINDHKNCSEQRSSGDSSLVYHLGRCLQQGHAAFDRIRENLTHFYGCQRDQHEWKQTEQSCGQNEDAKKVPGIYVNVRDCVEIDRVGEIDQIFDIPVGIRKTAAQEYLTQVVLNESPGLEDGLGPIQWRLALCLLAAWVVVCLCLIRGVKSSGKVVYFTAIFPYIVMVILFVRAVMLPGASQGIHFYMVPDWSRLSDIKVWEGAAVQIFFSLSVAGGGLITLASYNRFNNNVLRDTFIICLGNCLTSVFAGFAIFSVLGFLATELGLEVKDVVKSGAGLAFIVYPDLVTRLPISPLWSVLFFAMLFTLGLDSEFAIVETLVTAVLDFEPRLRKRKTFVVIAICLAGVILGLPFTTRGGGYLIDLLDYYAAGWPYMFIALVELIIVSHIYGLENFFQDLHDMFQFSPSSWTKAHLSVLFMTVSPLIITVILIYSWAQHEPLTRGDYVYPEWANALGWAIALTAIIPVIVVAVAQILYKIVKFKGLHWKERFSRSFRHLLYPTSEWRANADEAMTTRANHTNSAVASSKCQNLPTAGHFGTRAGVMLPPPAFKEEAAEDLDLATQSTAIDIPGEDGEEETSDEAPEELTTPPGKVLSLSEIAEESGNVTEDQQFHE